MDIPEYTDTEYWDDLIQKFFHDRDQYAYWCNIEYYIWEYFKICLRSRNRYFFQHSLIPLLESEFSKHVVILSAGTEIYRARVDENYKLWQQWNDYSKIEYTPKVIERIEKRIGHTADTQKLWDEHEKFISSEYIKLIRERIESGFQGYDAKGSTAPPPGSATAGRCNPQGVSYLYAALEEHTAVAEIRPHIKDSISIAILKPSRDLKLINFDYVPTAVVEGEDFLFNNIQRQFSLLNKEKNGDYLITQYITSLIEHLGYDGLCFRSSLVYNGTNYVIFNPDDCDVVSSKLCYLSKVVYEYGQCK